MTNQPQDTTNCSATTDLRFGRHIHHRPLQPNKQVVSHDTFDTAGFPSSMDSNDVFVGSLVVASLLPQPLLLGRTFLTEVTGGFG